MLSNGKGRLKPESWFSDDLSRMDKG